MADYEQSVFISYAWGGEREDIVNEIDETLQQRGIRIVRDKRALGYRGSIKDYMERIGRGSCIIVVISDKYLRSPNCMFELVEIAENKQFHDRIFPVVLTDANIYDPLKRIEYIRFWEGKRKELAKAMKTLDPANLHGIREEMDQYDRIRDKISGITSILKDMNTLTPDMHRDSEFSNLYDAIVERLKEGSTDVTTEFNEITKKAEADRKAKEEAARLAAQKAEADRKAKEDRLAAQKEEEERLAVAKAEADRLAAQKAEAERLAQQKAEEERLAKAKAEADSLAAQKAEEGRLAQERAEEERLAKVKADREAQAEADQLAAQKAEGTRLVQQRVAEAEAAERLATQKAEEERLAKAKAEADRLAAQEAEAERLAQQKAEERKVKEQVVPVAAKVAPIAVAPVQKKPASKGLMYGVGAVVLLAVVGIGFSVLNSGNKNAPVSTPTIQAAVAPPATEAPATPTAANTATVAPTPLGGGTGKIAFVSNREGKYDYGIYIMNADGSGVTRLTSGTEWGFSGDPVWSPDGKYIAFDGELNNYYTNHIYRMNADGSGETRLTNDYGGYRPAWSPDGKYIAYDVLTSNDNRIHNFVDIYIMSADGSNSTRLTYSNEDGNPVWSPDGKRIAFISVRDSGDISWGDIYGGYIYIMNADGSNQTRLTGGDSPAWSPDGKHIAFTCDGVCIMNADGSGVTNLTDYGYEPSWSPDGKYIAFTSGREGNAEIYIMKADGSGVTRLTNNSTDDTSPAWQP